MSAYAHVMQRQFSARSLSSRGGSETESRYMVESGFYMTSFAATIFIASLVTLGVLLITLVISLTIMLESCQSRSKGVVEMHKVSDDYNYCKIFALHAELNSLGSDYFPSICRSLAIQHSKEYERDLNISLWVVERYFDTVTPLDDGLDVVLMDIDDIFPSNPQNSQLSMHRLHQFGCGDCFEEPKNLKQTLFLRLYSKLLASGWSLILLSRKPERQRNVTIEHLKYAGYRGWLSVVMRLDNEMEIDSKVYFSRRRVAMQKEGFRISGIISSQMDALTGPSLGQRIFKLASPLDYFSITERSHLCHNGYCSMVAPL